MRLRTDTLSLTLCVLLVMAPVCGAQNVPDFDDDLNRTPLTEELELQPEIGEALLTGVDGSGPEALSRDQIQQLMTIIEARLKSKATIVGVFENKTGGFEDVSKELERQQAIWKRATNRALVSINAGETLSEVDVEQFTEGSELDAQFDDLLNAVIEEDLAMDSPKPGQVNPADFHKVAERYRLLSATVLQYNNYTMLVGLSTGSMRQAAQANQEKMATRIQFRLDELKQLFLEG